MSNQRILTEAGRVQTSASVLEGKSIPQYTRDSKYKEVFRGVPYKSSGFGAFWKKLTIR